MPELLLAGLLFSRSCKSKILLLLSVLVVPLSPPLFVLLSTSDGREADSFFPDPEELEGFLGSLDLPPPVNDFRNPLSILGDAALVK